MKTKKMQLLIFLETFTRQLGLFLFVICCSSFSFAQSNAAASLSVSTQDETCTGNGKLRFNLTGLATNAKVSYAIYKQPNLDYAIEITSNSYSFVTAGDYKVIAFITSDSSETRKEWSGEIKDLKPTPLMFTLQIENEGEKKKIFVHLMAGSPQLYEIMSGPIQFPAQKENFFPGVIPGIYVVKVTDVCGESATQIMEITQK